MALTLYAHPFSSYCWKVLIPLYENDTAFTMEVLGAPDSAANVELARRWPFKRMPLLVDGDVAVSESSIIIEHLQLNHPGATRLLPESAQAALAVRWLDRCFDQYVHTPMQAVVANALRAPEHRSEKAVADACALLEVAYGWLELQLADGRHWASGEAFTLADCAAAPALFYADWVHRIDATQYPRVAAYRARLNARPSVARVIEGARPYRAFFPLGAPERD